MLHDPQVRNLSFTGSTKVGRVLLHSCADAVVQASMELSRDAPFLVLEGADIEEAVAGARSTRCATGDRPARRPTVSTSTAPSPKRSPADSPRRWGHSGSARASSPVPSSAPWSRPPSGQGGRPRRRGPRRRSPVRGRWRRPRRGRRLLPGDRPGRRRRGRELLDREISVRSRRSSWSTTRTRRCDGRTTPSSAHRLRVRRRRRRWDAGRAPPRGGQVAVNRGVVSDPAAPFGGMKQSGLGREGASPGSTSSWRPVHRHGPLTSGAEEH